MNTSNNAAFLTISAYLTGFSETDLLGTGMVAPYYAAIRDNNDPEVLGYFYEEVAAILASSHGDEASINEAIAARLIPDSCYNGIAKTIILLWYTGNYGNDVLSTDSYKEALVWNVAGAHPPGAKQPGYGSWALPPFSV